MAKKWDDYTAGLAVLGTWDPRTSFGRDLLAEMRELPTSANVGRQALNILRTTWSTIPKEVRAAAMDALQDAQEHIAQGMEALDELGDAPIVGWVVAGIEAVVKIQQGFSGVAEVQRSASNYEHGNGQAQTAWGTTARNRGMYDVFVVKEYAQFIKFRIGGDFDRKPCFTRKGGFRDAIFTGKTSPPDDPGKCAKEMRRGSGDSYGPWEGEKCGRSLGLSALLWPWWSAAYEPMLLPRWEGSPPGAPFQAGPSEDTNAILAGVQTELLTDGRKNLQHKLSDVTSKCDRFLAWFDERMAPNGGGGAQQIYEGFVREEQKAQKWIDAKRDPGHIPSPDAAAYWYKDAAGMIQPYPDQQDAGLDSWGAWLPPGDPERLGCTLAQHNAVVAVRAAFAQRRLATMRNVQLVKAAVGELGLDGIDPGARAAAEYMTGLSSTEKLLPYPGKATVVKAAKIQKKPKRAKVSKDGVIIPDRGGVGGKVLVGAAAVAGVGLIAAGASGLLTPKK